MDLRKSTIVSLCPFDIKESKPTIYPSEYKIPKATYPHGIQLLVIKDAKGFVYLDADRGSLKVNIPSEQIAKAVVDDYAKTVMGYSAKAQPGIFWVPGDYTLEVLLENHSELIEKYRTLQDNWFAKLVTLADDDWQKFKQHKMIANLQRLAAECLGLEREWITSVPDDTRLCPMCRTVVHPLAVLCSSCKYVLKPEEYAKNEQRFVEKA